MRASICTASTIGAFGTEYFGCHQPPIVTTASRGTVMRTPSRSSTAWASRSTSGSCSAGSRLVPMPTIGVATWSPRKPATRPPCVPELPEPTTTRSKARPSSNHCCCSSCAQAT